MKKGKLKLKAKIMVMMTVLVVLTCSCIGMIAIGNINKLGQYFEAEMKVSMLSKYDGEIKHQVEMLDTQLKELSAQIQSGAISKEAGEKLAESIIREARYGEEGYFWADRVNGENVVSLGDRQVEGKNRLHTADVNGYQFIAEMIRLAQKEGGGYVDYYMVRPGSKEAIPKRAYVQLNTGFGWVIGTGNYTDDIDDHVALVQKQVQDDLIRSSLTMGLCSLVLIGVGIAVAYFIAKSIVDPIRRATAYLQVIETGDFTRAIHTQDRERTDEIGMILNGIATMQEKLKGLATSIYEESYRIEEEVAGVVQTMGSLSGHLQDVAATTQQLAAGMEETSASSEEMSATTQEIEKAVESIAKRSEEGALTANNIRKKAATTKKDVQEAERKASVIITGTKAELQKAIEAAKVVQKISLLSKAIMQITDQTNLLALNAAIEAARAGDAGRGFSVVAEEIRKLADQSKTAVLEIQEVITQVGEAVGNLSSSANQLMGFVAKDVVEDYHRMMEVAVRYDEDAMYVDELVTEFSATSQELLASIQNIMQAIEGVAAAANEGAMGTTDIANRVTDANHKGFDVTKQVEKTKASTEQLKTQISSLKI
ncbi:MAG: methyl-accepting chemotaxis protein [Cellulosilyticaceae bacterium]